MKSGGKQPFRPKHPSSFHHDLWMRQELCPHLLQEHLGGWRNQLDFFWEFHGSGFSNYSCLRKLESRQGGAGGRSPPSQLLEWVWVAICHPLFPMEKNTLLKNRWDAAPPERRRPASFSSLGEHMGQGAWRWQLPLWMFPGKFEMGHLQLRAGTQYVFPKCQFGLLSNQGFLHWKDKKLPQSNKSYNL